MVITTAGTTEKSGTLAKRKKPILHIYALMLALFALSVGEQQEKLRGNGV